MQLFGTRSRCHGDVCINMMSFWVNDNIFAKFDFGANSDSIVGEHKTVSLLATKYRH